jgi:hypothetical protein
MEILKKLNSESDYLGKNTHNMLIEFLKNPKVQDHFFKNQYRLEYMNIPDGMSQ